MPYDELLLASEEGRPHRHACGHLHVSAQARPRALELHCPHASIVPGAPNIGVHTITARAAAWGSHAPCLYSSARGCGLLTRRPYHGAIAPCSPVSSPEALLPSRVGSRGPEVGEYALGVVVTGWAHHARAPSNHWPFPLLWARGRR